MDSKFVYTKMRDSLANLYPDETNARRVSIDARIDPALVSFSSHAKNNWHNILVEADKQGKVDNLLAVALKEYGENKDLQEVCEAYRKRNLISKHPPIEVFNRDEKKKEDEQVQEPSGKPETPLPKNGSDGDIPEWFSYAGITFGALTLLFFMGLVVASLFGREVPTNSRFAVVIVVAMGSALSTSFLGGWAVAKGQISIPFVREHPIQFSAGGGIAVLIIVMLLGYWLYARLPPSPPIYPTPLTTSLPVVYLMDSKDLIYHPEDGGTNTENIRDILNFLPIMPPMEELVYYDWDGAEILYQLEPDLIIIHASAFYTTTNTADPAKKLYSFLRTMEDTDTKFLIYSRDKSFENEETIKKYYENEHTPLEGRIEVLWVPKTEYCAYWKCSETREELRRKVKSLLGIS